MINSIPIFSGIEQLKTLVLNEIIKSFFLFFWVFPNKKCVFYCCSFSTTVHTADQPGLRF